MARELIQIFIGQAGCQIGDACWELFAQEHAITADGEACCIDQSDAFNGSMFRDSECFFEECKCGNFSPRAIFVDTEPTVVDEIRSGYYRKLFRASTLISGCEDAASNFARGYYQANQDITSNCCEALRKLMEHCDKLQGVVFYRAFGGGTGSGFTCSFIQNMTGEFVKVPLIDVAIVPSSTLMSGPVEPYNAILSCQFPIDDVDLAILMDNHALQTICFKKLGINKPTFSNLNRTIAQNISGITAAFRFQGPAPINMADLRTNLVPYPSAHFALSGFAPYLNVNETEKNCIDTFELTTSVFASSNQLITHTNAQPVYLSCCMIYRGNVSVRDANAALINLRQSGELPWVDWCPTGFKVGINYQPMTCIRASRLGCSDCSVVALHNSTLFKDTLHGMLASCRILLSKKSFLHWYEYEGLEEEQFYIAMERLEVLERDYDSFIQESNVRGDEHAQGVNNDRVSPNKTGNISQISPFTYSEHAQGGNNARVSPNKPRIHSEYSSKSNLSKDDCESVIEQAFCCNTKCNQNSDRNANMKSSWDNLKKSEIPRITRYTLVHSKDKLMSMVKENLDNIPLVCMMAGIDKKLLDQEQCRISNTLRNKFDKKSQHSFTLKPINQSIKDNSRGRSSQKCVEEDEESYKTTSTKNKRAVSTSDRLRHLKKETLPQTYKYRRSCSSDCSNHQKKTNHHGHRRHGRKKSTIKVKKRSEPIESTSSVLSGLDEIEIRRRVRNTVEAELDEMLNIFLS